MRSTSRMLPVGAPEAQKPERILILRMQASRHAGLGRDDGTLCSDLPCPRQIGGSVSTSFRNDEGQPRLSMPPSTTCPAGRITEVAVQCRASYPVHSEPYTYARLSVAVIPAASPRMTAPEPGRLKPVSRFIHPVPAKGTPAHIAAVPPQPGRRRPTDSHCAPGHLGQGPWGLAP